MIFDLFAIYRARKHPKLAAKLAARFAQNQTIERVTAPVFIAHLALWVVMALCACFTMGLIWLGVELHWTAALPGLIPLAVGILAFRINAGLQKGMERIRMMAESFTDRRIDRLLSTDVSDQQEG